MSMTGLERQEQLVYGEDNSIKNFPMSSKILWGELYPAEKQTWAYRFGFRKNIEISHCGQMVKEAYEAVDKTSQERRVPVAQIWEEISRYNPTNGFMFDSDIESPYQNLDKYITLADSGSAYSGTMRTIQWISKNGVDSKYIKDDDYDIFSALFSDNDIFRMSIISVGLLAFFGKIVYDDYSK
jgi:hypothetical protein